MELRMTLSALTSNASAHTATSAATRDAASIRRQRERLAIENDRLSDNAMMAMGPSVRLPNALEAYHCAQKVQYLSIAPPPRIGTKAPAKAIQGRAH